MQSQEMLDGYFESSDIKHFQRGEFDNPYIEREIPHIATLMRDTIEDVMTESQAIVIGNKAPEFRQAVQQARQDQVIIDLVRISQDIDPLQARYQGICW